MEPRFGHDFSHVRIHTGEQADESARSIYALAYAVGSNIAFASGQFNPRSPAGQRLLAHELAHVVQQRNGAVHVQRSPDMRWVHDEKAARYRGRVMAARIRKHGKLSKEARAKIKSELQYFEGSARDAYLEEVRPALPSVVKFEAPVPPARDEPPQPAPPSPPKESPKTCKRLPDVGPGKKCKFFVYDSTLSGALGIAWKRLAIADARVHSASYAIPSGENMEEMLYNVLSTYAEEGCDCTDEIQFWSHGSRGNGAWISDSHGGTSELETKHFEIPGVDQFGDNPKQPGYQEWSSKLSTYQHMLVVLRRTICDSDSTIYYRSCQAFQGEEGRKFARASSEFWRCNVAGHTKNIGLSQPGQHVLPVCQEPDWPESEGTEEETKKNKPKLREVKPK